jgi:hypothetical protein
MILLVVMIITFSIMNYVIRDEEIHQTDKNKLHYNSGEFGHYLGTQYMIIFGENPDRT